MPSSETSPTPVVPSRETASPRARSLSDRRPCRSPTEVRWSTPSRRASRITRYKRAFVEIHAPHTPPKYPLARASGQRRARTSPTEDSENEFYKGDRRGPRINPVRGCPLDAITTTSSSSGTCPSSRPAILPPHTHIHRLVS